MISEIREYFRNVVNIVDSDLKELDQVFVDTTIGNTRLDNTYYLEIGEMSIEEIDSQLQGEISVVVKLYKHGYNDLVTNFDETYCKAINVHTTAQVFTRSKNGDYIRSVEASSIVPEPIDSDENSMSFTINFSVKVLYNAN